MHVLVDVLDPASFAAGLAVGIWSALLLVALITDHGQDRD